MNILLIAGNLADVALINSELVQATGPPYALEHVETLSAGLQRLQSGSVDVLLTDLYLSDSEGLETFRRLRQHVPHLPILVLVGKENESTGRLVLSEGAQNLLIKSEIRGCQLLRKIREAIHRHRQPLAPDSTKQASSLSTRLRSPSRT